MRTGRPTLPIMLTSSERETLEQWARRRTTAQALAQRARLILACAAGQLNHAVAQQQRVTPQTVSKWRQRFLRQRLAGWLDEPRPGRAEAHYRCARRAGRDPNPGDAPSGCHALE